MVDATLEDTAAMSVGSYLNAVGSHCVVDKLVVFWLEGVETFLDDMIAVKIFDEGDNVTIESRHESGHLARCCEMVNESLNGASSMAIDREEHKQVVRS